MWLWESTKVKAMTNAYHYPDDPSGICEDFLLCPMSDAMIAARAAKRTTLLLMGLVLVGLAQLGLALS